MFYLPSMPDCSEVNLRPDPGLHRSSAESRGKWIGFSRFIGQDIAGLIDGR